MEAAGVGSKSTCLQQALGGKDREGHTDGCVWEQTTLAFSAHDMKLLDSSLTLWGQWQTSKIKISIVEPLEIISILIGITASG